MKTKCPNPVSFSLLLLAITLLLVSCGSGQYLGPTVVPTSTNTPTPSATSTPAATNTLTATTTSITTTTPTQVAITAKFHSNLYHLSLNYPDGWHVSERQDTDYQFTEIDIASDDGTSTLTLVAKASDTVAGDAELMGTLGAFGEMFLGQNESLQTERAHIVMIDGKRFAIAVYSDSLIVACYQDGGTVVFAFGVTSPENQPGFRKIFEGVLGSLQQ